MSSSCTCMSGELLWIITFSKLTRNCFPDSTQYGTIISRTESQKNSWSNILKIKGQYACCLGYNWVCVVQPSPEDSTATWRRNAWITLYWRNVCIWSGLHSKKYFLFFETILEWEIFYINFLNLLALELDFNRSFAKCQWSDYFLVHCFKQNTGKKLYFFFFYKLSCDYTYVVYFTRLSKFCFQIINLY